VFLQRQKRYTAAAQKVHFCEMGCGKSFKYLHGKEFDTHRVGCKGATLASKRVPRGTNTLTMSYGAPEGSVIRGLCRHDTLQQRAEDERNSEQVDITNHLYLV
jgi:hypothetical protein